MIAIFVIALILCIDNKNIDYEYFEIDNKSGNTVIKVAHLSDLHFPKIEVDLTGMLEVLAEVKPDIIAITGDIVDSSCQDVAECGVFDFLTDLIEIAPVYFVDGNHDVDQFDIYKLYAFFTENGIKRLCNESVNTNINGKAVTIIGLNDNADYDDSYLANNTEAVNNYKILLAHRPEKWLNYISETNAIRPDLVLSGHAHGGQIRIGNYGLYSPNQGFLPEYSSGLYISDDDEVRMIVSRGIGNSILSYRVLNKPHIPIITIKL